MNKWKIYYDDGKILSSEDSPISEAPTDGVLCVLVVYEDGASDVLSGADYYIFEEDGQVHTTSDLGPFLRQIPNLKHGRWAPARKFERAVAQAVEDRKKLLSG